MKRPGVRLLLGALLAGAVGCGYSPNPPSMKLLCAPDLSCPEGYTCVSGTCWRPSEANLVGHWVFGMNAVQTVACDDGSTQMTQLQGPTGFIDLVLGTASAFSTFYFCEWNLDVAGSSTVIQPNQSCSAPDMVNPTTTYTWASWPRRSLTTTRRSLGTAPATCTSPLT
jgi:hypothetical protein